MVQAGFEALAGLHLPGIVDSFVEPRVADELFGPHLCKTIAETLVYHTGISHITGTVAIVIGDIIIPQRAEVYLGVVLFLIYVCTPETIYVGTQLCCYIPRYNGSRVNHWTIAGQRVGERGVEQPALELIQIIAYVIYLRSVDVILVGRLHCDHKIASCSKIYRFACCEAVNLKQITTGDVACVVSKIILFKNLDSLVVNVYVIRNLVVAKIGSIEHQVHKTRCRIERQAKKFAHLRCHCIPEQRLVAVIGKERPALVLCISFSQELCRLIELYAIGFLCKSPGRITASPNLHILVADSVGTGNIYHCGIYIVGLAGYRFRPLSVNIDCRNVCLLHIYAALSIAEYSYNSKQ